MDQIDSYAAIHVQPADVEASRFINSFVEQAQKLRDHYEPQWEENWANYRVQPYLNASHNAAAGNPYADSRYSSLSPSMQLKTPESHQITNTLVAVLLASLYGTRDYVRAEPVGDEDIQKALKVSQLVMYGLERKGGYRTDYEALKDAVIFGTGCWSAGWRTDIRKVPRRIQVPGQDGQPQLDPQTGAPISALVNVDYPIYDDVSRAAPSLYDIWFDPGATRIGDSDGIVERIRMSRDTLRAMARTPGWIGSGIASVIASKPNEWARGPGNDTGPKLFIEGLTKDDVKNIAAFGYYGGYRYTGILPSEVAARLGVDPSMSHQLAIINGIMVQLGQNPQYKGEVPYGTISILPTGGSMYGLSPLTVIRYLQDVSDTQLILTVQAMLESVYQNYVVGGAAGVGPNFHRQLMNRKPREVFPVPGDITQIAPLAKDYAGLQMAAQTLQLLSSTMRDASAARDPVQGIQSNDRSTATEVQTVATAALQNVDQLASLIERDELPRTGDHIFGLYYVNLDDEGKFIRRVGEDAATKVQFADLDADFDFTFVGARHAVSRQKNAADFMQFLQILMSNPMGAAQVNIGAAAQWFSDHASEARGLMDIIEKDPNEVIAKMQVMGIGGPMVEANPQAQPAAGGKKG